MNYSSFWVLDGDGKKILRDFKEEHQKGFTIQKYWNGEGFDDFNYMYFENFELHDLFGSFGSDYERYWCVINEGDTVVDIGANVGMFSRWAKSRGASRIISFEPMSDTFSCLVDNSNDFAECHKIAISSKLSKMEMFRLDRKNNLGGGTSVDIEGREKVNVENVISASIEDLMSIGILPKTIDFLKIDCEGGEADIIDSILDETIMRIGKISMEYHEGILGNDRRISFTQRMESLGFKSFTLYHGDGSLIQLHFWRAEDEIN